jgi:hypothetical protein
MSTLQRTLTAIVVLCLCAAPAAAAQTDIPDPTSSARVRFGPLFLAPTLALTNMGIDDNVFNEPTVQGPKRDFTLTVTPATDLWLRLGPGWLTGTLKEDLVYYKTYASERSANDNYKGGLLFPLTRLVLAGNATYIDTRERPGFEIDSRARRHQTGFDGSVELKVLSRTFVGARASRQRVRYDAGEEFLGTDLRTELNRDVTSESLDIRLALTPLTTLLFSGSKTQDRFQFSKERDADSTLAAIGAKFDPMALIKGSVLIGYRDYRPVQAGVPGFRGLTVDADLSYVAFGSTKLGLKVRRDIEYSFDRTQPYYVLSGFSASLDQRVYGPMDVIGRFGLDRLAYRDTSAVAPSLIGRTDRVRTYGGSVGYRLGRDVRVALNADIERRQSILYSRVFEATRIGFSATYGF